MKCYTIAQVVNYVNMHKDFFRITKERACWADCTGFFRVSKLSTHEMKFFEFCKLDHTAQVFLPEAVKKSDLKKALKLTQNTKFTDFFDDASPEWTFMQVTPNRMLVFDQIVKNSMPKVEQKPTEVEELKTKIKELEEKLAKYNSTTERTICNYMTIKNGIATIHSDSLVCKSALHVFTDTYAEREQVRIEDVIEQYQQLAAVHNDIAANLKRAKFDGANYVQCKP